MNLNYFELKDKNNLTNRLFKLSFSKESLPFKSVIIPIGFPTLTYIYNERKISITKDAKQKLKGLIITGQHYRAYDFMMKNEGLICGIEFHPTAFYKIFKTDASTISNKHIKLSTIDKKKSKKFLDIFLMYQNDEDLFIKKMLDFLESLELYNGKDVKEIDKAIHLILKKEGMLQISDLLNVIPFSQKTLETKFKKIIGFTPGRYIRLVRFTSLMKKYETGTIDLKTLMYDYNYYDESHLKKDFKRFLNKTPNAYFKKNYPLIKKYLQ
ncbi:helix-turn-helix domain-containing protein [Polaribacter sp. R77954]|uniref:helix-turn-helix domain-containing protein n=1 Tax=Polaribacter sp. R77954 TaxID=3093870 RepID=UPI0037C934F8